MKRLLILTGILIALVGTAVLLPALAHYGRSAAMETDAQRATRWRPLFTGSLLTVAGGAVLLYGARKRPA
jgi:hypothetical protein